MPRTIDYRECKCRCGARIAIPVRDEWTDPLCVMRAIDDVEEMRRHVAALQGNLMQLAEECVNAGVRPEVLRRADEMLAAMTAMRETLDRYPRRLE